MIYYIPVKISHPIVDPVKKDKTTLQDLADKWRSKREEKNNGNSMMSEVDIEPSVPYLSSRRIMFSSEKGNISCVLFDKMRGVEPFYELYSHETLFEDTIRVPTLEDARRIARGYLIRGK